ncbi:hypothetical protein ABFS83_14G226400 [Erythranthe nasuta]
MDDPRVHPTTADPPPPPPSSSNPTSPKHSGQNQKPQNLTPPPEIYVVQLPREQIFRVPPPENARKFEALTRRKPRRSCCRRCCCFTLCLVLLLFVAAAVSAGVMHFVFRFKSPKYAVTDISIKGMNLTSAAPISPDFNVSVRAENPNGKVGIYYLKGSAVTVFYSDVKLSNGVFPVFYQPKKNVTAFSTPLTGSTVVLGAAVRREIMNAQNQGRVPLVVNVKAPVNIKVGSAKTWEITAKVKCDVVVDTLSERAKIVSNKCRYNVRLW